MRIFLSYRFTGEKLEDVASLLLPVKSALEQLGHTVYTNFYDEHLQPGTENHKSFLPKDYMSYAFAKLPSQDVVIVLLNSNNKSEGMLLEVGYALAKGIPVVTAAKKTVTDTYLPQIGKLSFTWENIDDLVEKIKALNFSIFI